MFRNQIGVGYTIQTHIQTMKLFPGLVWNSDVELLGILIPQLPRC